MNKRKIKYLNSIFVKGGAAFTLVELIVVITILAILGAIAFISLQGYSTQARDSTRISDLASMKSSLELYQVDAGKYPLPTNGINVTYSGATVWSQGIFGETVYANVEKLDKIPTDPLTGNSYTYSVTSTKTEYQLGGILEGDEVVIRNNGISKTNAGETIANAIVTGSYNGVVTKSNSGTLCNVLALPSIITNDITVTDLQQIVTNNSFVYRGYKNLPGSFAGSKFKQNGGFAFQTNNLSSYTDNANCGNITAKTSSGTTARVQLLKGLQDAYTGTILKDVGEIKSILDLTISTSSPSQEVVNYAGNFVNNSLGGNIYADISNSLTGWRALDTNCDIPDITKGTQVWAGCNSTLGTGFEWGKRDNGTDGTISSCYNYNGSNTATCTIGSASMASNTKANTWYSGTNTNGDTEYSAIWGKLYTWANSSSACPAGRHIPTDAQWEILETTLNGSNCRNATDGFLCNGLGWKLHNTKTTSNNMAKALNIPLAGNRNTDGITFAYRGNYTLLWSSTSTVSDAFTRYLDWNYSTVYRSTSNKTNGLSVRCLKN